MYLSAIEVDPSPTAPTHHIYCEDFSHKLARGHCEQAINDFWGCPARLRPNATRTQRDQTTSRANKHQTNKSHCAASAPSSGRSRCSNVKTNEQTEGHCSTSEIHVQNSCAEGARLIYEYVRSKYDLRIRKGLDQRADVKRPASGSTRGRGGSSIRGEDKRRD